MPRIPEYQQRTSAQGPISLAPASPQLADQEGLAALGQAIAGTGELLTRLKEHDRALQVASLAADSETQLAKFAQDLATDSDYGTHVDRYQQAVKGYEDQVTGSVKDRAVVNLWRADFKQQALRRELEVRKSAITGLVGVQKATLDSNLAAFSSLAGEDPENDALLREKGRLAISQAFTSGVLSPTEAVDLDQRFRSDIISARVRRDIAKDPDGTIQRLLTDDYKDLSGDDRAKWIDKANAAAESVQRQRIADSERDHRLAEREQKEIEESTAKTGDSLAAEGKLSPAWVEAHREALSKEDFRYFYKVATGVEEGPREAMTYADLRSRAGQGQDIRGEARTALQMNRITRSDFDRLLGEVEAQYPGWKKVGDTYLSTVSGYSEINPQPGAAQTKAAMLDQWTQWAAEHPKATDEEARKAYVGIADNYNLAGNATKLFTLPTPKFMVGSRTEMDLDATEAETMKALDEGRITPEEAAKQAVLMQEWRSVFVGEKQKAAKK